MEHAQCANVIGSAVIVNYHSAVRRVVLNVHPHCASGQFRIGLGVNGIRIRFTE